MGIVNAMFLAAEHHGQPPVLEYILKIVTDVFTFIFLIEAILKILGLSKKYFRNGWDIFDFSIVIASLFASAANKLHGITVIRTLRLMRVFRIAKSWETMRILLEITINTIGALVNLTVVLCIIVYVFAIIGLDLFRDKYRGHDFGGSEGESEGDDDGDGKGSVDTKSSEERQSEEEVEKDEDDDEDEDEDEDENDIDNKIRKKLVEPAECCPHCRCSKRICKSDSFFGKRWWMFRQDLLWIVDNDWFENIVLLVVFANSSALILDDIFLVQKPWLKEVLWDIDIAFCIFFTLEMIMKWCAYGFHEYFTQFWTVLDFVIVLATFEGWMEVMQSAVDATTVDEQPRFENNLYQGYIYFVVFIVIGSFFTLNLFISVIVDNFLSLRKRVIKFVFRDIARKDASRLE
nr:hypothetical protein BaRGS_023027 [Batillaria attramentaria]